MSYALKRTEITGLTDHLRYLTAVETDELGSHRYQCQTLLGVRRIRVAQIYAQPLVVVVANASGLGQRFKSALLLRGCPVCKQLKEMI